MRSAMTSQGCFQWLHDRGVLSAVRPLRTRHRCHKSSRRSRPIRAFGRLAPSCPVEQLEARTLLAVVIEQNFTGNTLNNALNLGEGSFAPPDTMGAVGVKHIIMITNGVI